MDYRIFVKIDFKKEINFLKNKYVNKEIFG